MTLVIYSPFGAKLQPRIKYPGFAMSLLRSILPIALTLLVTLPQAALAVESDPISVKVNMARILKINAPAATVIIGNPGVADVTIQDPQTLILTGKSYGETNLIILDAKGNAIADTMLNVVQGQGDLITVYQGAARTTMACQPICQATITLGDDSNFTGMAVASSGVLQNSASSK